MNIDSLSTKEELREGLEQALKKISELEGQNAVLREKVSILEEDNNRLRRALYAAKSEKKVSKNDDKTNINDPLPDVDEPDVQSASANTDTGADTDSGTQASESDEQTSDVNATTDSSKQKTDTDSETQASELLSTPKGSWMDAWNLPDLRHEKLRARPPSLRPWPGLTA